MRNKRKLLFKFPSGYVMMVLSYYVIFILWHLCIPFPVVSILQPLWQKMQSFPLSKLDTSLLFCVTEYCLQSQTKEMQHHQAGDQMNIFCLIPKYLQHIEISVIPSEDLHIVATFHLELSRFRECGCNGSCISFGKNSSVRSFSAIFMCAVTSTHPVSYKNPCHELESMPGSHCHLTPHWTLSYLCRGAQNRCRAEKKW